MSRDTTRLTRTVALAAVAAAAIAVPSWWTAGLAAVLALGLAVDVALERRAAAARIDDRIVEFLARCGGPHRAERDVGETSVRIAHALGAGPGSLFPALARLERDGRVTSEWAVVGGQRRRIYRAVPAAPAAPCDIRGRGGCDGQMTMCRGCDGANETHGGYVGATPPAGETSGGAEVHMLPRHRRPRRDVRRG